MNSSRYSLPTTAAMLLVSLASLTACSPNHHNLYNSKGSYGTFDEAKEGMATEQALVHIPSVIPADATDIQFVSSNDGMGTQLTWKSDSQLTFYNCEPGTLSGALFDLDVEWWPVITPTEGTVCGQWQVFESGDSFYAWSAD